MAVPRNLDHAAIVAHYKETQGMGATAFHFGCSRATVLHALRKFGVPRTGKPGGVRKPKKPKPPKPPKPTLEEKFWPLVQKSDDPDGCWLWQGGVDNSKKGGYGYISFDGRRLKAHQAAWELTHGPIPEGQQVLHNCDVRYPPGDRTNRRCVRPDHLFLGTHADNIRDKVQKGRQESRAAGWRTLSPARIEHLARHFNISPAELLALIDSPT